MPQIPCVAAGTIVSGGEITGLVDGKVTLVSAATISRMLESECELVWANRDRNRNSIREGYARCGSNRNQILNGASTSAIQRDMPASGNNKSQSDERV